MADMVGGSSIRTAYLQAKRAYCLAEVALIDEQLAATERPSPVATGSTTFDPKWKSGIRLSREGEAAILAAYERLMPQNQVGELFQISPTAAHNWHEKWKRSRRS